MPVKDTDEAVAFINARDHPLVVYVFSQDKAFQDKGIPPPLLVGVAKHPALTGTV